MSFIHPLLKPEHTLRELLVYMLRQFRIIRVWVVAVIEFHNMKAAAVHIKMNIPLFKIRSDRLPDLHLQMQLFHLAPSRIADTLAVHMGRNKKNLKISHFSFDLKYHTANILTVTNYAVGFSAVNRLFYRLTGNDLFVFFKMIVPASEFLQRSVIERLLIIEVLVLSFHKHLSLAPRFSYFVAKPIIAAAEGLIENHSDFSCVDLAVFTQYGFICGHVYHFCKNSREVP